ncbi:hypothetical protein C1H46_024952 [Malus baccata]|uniref:Uncharacterized protein n=1 Tax=Malus baccata TaxID=106549 RepID=A0A540LSW2_MALBA|nr:hypothetical protein C1H46_024952 [Malus baccata]
MNYGDIRRRFRVFLKLTYVSIGESSPKMLNSGHGSHNAMRQKGVKVFFPCFWFLGYEGGNFR